jgi:hypothetical protein
MTFAVQVVEGTGRAEVVKSVGLEDVPAVDHLQREAARLRRAAHPGVVEVVAAGPVDGRWVLRTVHAGRPASAAGTLTAPQCARLVASAATTLADLHQLGMAHGRIDAEHVLVGPDGRSVLCGFGSGIDGPPATAADDVAALGHLLTALLAQPELDPIPDRRWARRRSSDWERRALLAVADLACADVPTRRPTARRLAASLVAAVPERPGTSGPSEASVPAGRGDPLGRARLASASASAIVPRRPRARLLGAAGVLLLAVAVVRLAGPPAADDDGRAATGPIVVEPPRTALSPDQDPASTAAGTLDASVTVQGRTVTRGAERFEVGAPGDLIEVGDWDCDRVATPAVLRPSSGEVFVFPSWGTGGPVEVGPVRSVPGAVSLLVGADESGCSTLAVRTGADVVVEIVAGRA